MHTPSQEIKKFWNKELASGISSIAISVDLGLNMNNATHTHYWSKTGKPLG